MIPFSKLYIWVTCIFLLSTAPLMAYDSVALNKLKNTNSCQNCDLSNANLSGLELWSANLSNAYLAGVNMKQVNLSGANLSNANLSRANLYYANMTHANLSGTKLSCAYLYRVNFYPSQLPDVIRAGGNLSGSLIRQDYGILVCDDAKCSNYE